MSTLAHRRREDRLRGGGSSLPHDINAATRPFHTHLNRLILARLPLALPPHANNPELYAIGLRHIAPLYIAFESAWEDLLEDGALHPPSSDDFVFSALKHLYIPELLRTDTIKADLAVLLQQPRPAVEETLHDPEGSHLRKVTEHIQRTLASKPHVLIAYAWVMYMALFNGGRWIRAQLMAARDSAWRKGSEQLGTDSATGLSFWHFPGNEDGEDLKNAFKLRLAAVEGLLTLVERQDIVGEAQQIFQHLALLVGELDEMVAVRQWQAHAATAPLPNLLAKHVLPLGMVELLGAFLRWIVAVVELFTGGGRAMGDGAGRERKDD